MMAHHAQLFSFSCDHLTEKNDILCAFLMWILEKDCACLLFAAANFLNFFFAANLDNLAAEFAFFFASVYIFSALLSQFLLLFSHLSCCCFLFAGSLGS